MPADRDSIKIKFHQTSEEVAVDMSTLKEWIDSGKVTEDDLIKGEILTGGQWKRAADTSMFYPGSRGAETVSSAPVGSSWRAEPFHRRHSERYLALRMISGLLKVAAVVVGIGTLVLVAIVAGMSHGDVLAFTIPAVLLQGGVAVVVLWAFAELIGLLIDIEGNTRRAAEAAEVNKNPAGRD